MKIRINGNSVRIRLSKSEVDRFGKEGYIEEHTNFGSGKLTYALATTDKENMHALFEGSKITMYLPAPKAVDWVNSQKVGYDANMDIGEGEVLYLLLEKDFKCLDNTMEDQGDNYDNPLAAQFNKK